MSDDRWIVVPNWSRFQHYTDREPVWIKVYSELNSRDDWRTLTASERGLLVSIWIEFGRARGVLRVHGIHERLGLRHDSRTLASLNHAGFIQIVASKPLALPRSREREVEREKKVLSAPAQKKPVDNSNVQRANVLPKDPVQAIRTMIHNGVITDNVELEAELKALDLNTQRNTHLAEELRALITQEGT